MSRLFKVKNMKRDLLLKSIPHRINSNRLCYRIMDLDDTYTVVKLRNANHVRDNYIYQKPITVEEHINYYHTQIETGHIIQYVMLTKKTNKIIGCVFLKNIDLEAKSAEYGVFIGDSKELGKGYGKDALDQMIDIAFNVLMLNSLTLRVLSYNAIAIKIYTNAGFVEKERIIDEDIASGKKREVIIMELVKGR